jgi:serine/threonine-protein kinase
MNETNIQTYLGKFEIIECYKKDYYSAVYLANHIYLGKKIILKTLNSVALEDKSILERFNREAKILAKLEHTNIIRILDFGFYETIFYLSFEYFESKTLREIIQKNSLTDLQKKNLLIQLFQALEYAHQHQIVHRDIKPENILVDESLHLKIADFGLALGLNEKNITNQYSIVGTPSYMSPEQIRGEKLTPQSDLFSTGIVVYEMFKGNNPFIGNDISQTINNILMFDEKSLNEQISSLDEDIKKIISLLLQKSCEKRAGSSTEILSVLGYSPIITEKRKIGPLKKISLLKYFFIIIIITVSTLVLWNILKDNKETSIKSEQPFSLNENKSLTKQSNSDIKSNVEPLIKEKKTTESSVPNKNPSEEVVQKNINNYEQSIGFGKIFIECSPWADIYIDSQRKETTPLKEYISLSAEKHSITLKHPDYPDYSFITEIYKDQSTYLKFNLNTLFGFLNCKIFPWGEVFVDGEFKGSTPLQNNIPLNPGEHKILIKNPNFDDYDTSIFIKKAELSEFRYNFNPDTKK